jgi:hypothetical protein
MARLGHPVSREGWHPVSSHRFSDGRATLDYVSHDVLITPMRLTRRRLL